MLERLAPRPARFQQGQVKQLMHREVLCLLECATDKCVYFYLHIKHRYIKGEIIIILEACKDGITASGWGTLWLLTHLSF